jgi:hypothetical protein
MKGNEIGGVCSPYELGEVHVNGVGVETRKKEAT